MFEIVHPEYQRLGETADRPVEIALTPVYPTTEGLQQLTLRRLSEQALAHLSALSAEQANTELLPPQLLARLGLPELPEALRYVHRPPPDAALSLLEKGGHPAQRRLAFEELLAHHLSRRQIRAEILTHRAPSLGAEGHLADRLRSLLPFTLTGAQERVIREIEQDLHREVPMLRLLQGDVGAGKTVVAGFAAVQALECGFQAAIMAPTELLAEQHLRTFGGWMEALGLATLCLAGKLSKATREDVLARIAGEPRSLVIGTHALFQDQVRFARLGLTIIDEQHRFGVHQRLALRDKGQGDAGLPHQLIMTATPIPRTLAMTAYADLDASILDELPPQRSPVHTVVMPSTRREDVIARIAKVCREQRQVYWVCTLIDESEALQCQAATNTALELAEHLTDARVGLIHGRMKAEEREQVMGAFKSGGLDLLVATTVIEVGVDVPNASLMIIENAERLGLAQLHQLRGRVGRGTHHSDCVLMYHPPLSDAARARLATIRDTTDGFQIAEKDLEIRGPGEVLGTRQAGLAQMRIADLARDRDLLPSVESTATELLRDHPERIAPLIRRWLGDAVRYGSV
jgi:ATP-dependent DNA helicase RecG